MPAVDQEVKEKVRRYYQAATEDYLKYYESDWHHHMHYGFDRDLLPGGNPTEHLVRYLARLAGLAAPEGVPAPGAPEVRPAAVLDAGCGVGGSAIWLARELGCRCVGITLMENQARLAMGFAARPARPSAPSPAVPAEGRGAGNRARFAVNDFTHPAFKDATFDVVWAVESFDHAPDKAAWIREMGRVLKPGGRIVIADGFRSERPQSPVETRDYARFLAGWAVPHLCTFAELERWAREAGFAVDHAEDVSADVLPHARAIYRFGLLFIPFRWALHRLGLANAEKLGNAYATYFQYRTLRRGLWRYGVFCLRKLPV